jgi:hypothetical protein
VQQQKGAPDTIMTNNDDQSPINLSGLTSGCQSESVINLNHIDISDIDNSNNSINSISNVEDADAEPSNSIDDMDTNVSNATEQTPSSSFGGWPKETTNEAKSEQAKSLVNVKNWCVIKYEEHNRHRVEIEKKKRARRGLLEEFMRQASINFESPLQTCTRKQSEDT